MIDTISVKLCSISDRDDDLALDIIVTVFRTLLHSVVPIAPFTTTCAGKEEGHHSPIGKPDS